MLIHSKCEICGKHRNVGSHKRCSREKQRMYAPGTALRAAQDAEQQGRKDSYVYRPLEVPERQKGGFFSRLVRSDS